VDFPQGTVGRHKAPKSKLPMSCTIVVVVVVVVVVQFSTELKREVTRIRWKKIQKNVQLSASQPLSHINSAREYTSGEYLSF